MKKWNKQGRELLDEIENTKVSDEEAAIWYLGQCGFLVKSEDQSVLIDPVLTDLLDAEGNTKRYYPAPFDPEELKVDVVLCTHEHRDHMNVDTLKGLLKANPDLKIIVPRGVLPKLEEQGFLKSNLVGINEKEIAKRQNMRLQTVQTAHPVHQKSEKEQDLNLAYYVDFNGITILHLGDTYLTEKLLADLKGLPDVDVLMTPINGQDYFRTARNCIGNLSGYESAMLAKELKAGMTIPTHYDMMKGNTCTPYEFLEAMENEYSGGKVALPALGERIIIRKEKPKTEESEKKK